MLHNNNNNNNSLSPLPFVVALIPLSMVLGQTRSGYEQGNRKGHINHLPFVDDLKLYGKNEKQVDTLVFLNSAQN